MGNCKSNNASARATLMERRGTDSSAPLPQIFTASDAKMVDPMGLRPEGSRSSQEIDDDDDKDEIFYDAVEEENRFPLTFAPAHHFEPFDGLEERLQQAIKTGEKAPLRNAFTDPPSTLFMVRGPDYLKEGKGGKNLKNLKVPSNESPYELIGVNMFRSPERMNHPTNQIGDLRRYLDTFPADKEGSLFSEFLVVNWLLSSMWKKEFFVVQHVFRLRSHARTDLLDAPLSNAMGRFLAGSVSERNAQFKYVFRCVDAPSAVKNSISFLGGERPVLIGKSLTTTYNSGRNHLEINMDVSSSKIATAINGVVLKNVETVVMDCSWLLEGQRDEELPERVLAKIRWIWNCTEDVIVNLDEAGERL